jgi:hypothetical protein
LLVLVLLLGEKDIGNGCCGVLEGADEVSVPDSMLEKVVGDSEMSDEVSAALVSDEVTEVPRAEIAIGREARLARSESLECIAISIIVSLDLRVIKSNQLLLLILSFAPCVCSGQ